MAEILPEDPPPSLLLIFYCVCVIVLLLLFFLVLFLLLLGFSYVLSTVLVRCADVITAVPANLEALKVRFRNALKGQGWASRGKRGQSVPWKKDEDPALPSDAPPFLVSLDKWKWWLLSLVSRRVVELIYPPTHHLSFFDVREHPGVRGFVALTVDDCFCRQGEDKSLAGTLRQLLAARSAPCSAARARSRMGRGAGCVPAQRRPRWRVPHASRHLAGQPGRGGSVTLRRQDFFFASYHDKRTNSSP